VTKITLAGDFDGSYEMENGAPPPTTTGPA